jgi:hypothetical protein
MKRILVYLAVLLIGAACGMGEALQDPGDPVPMTPAKLVGTWHGGTERFITFKEDGTFSAINLPVGPFHDYPKSIGFDATRQRLDGSGRWTVAGATVHLVFERLAGKDQGRSGPSADLAALRPADHKEYLVFFYVSDEGNSYTGYLKS